MEFGKKLKIVLKKFDSESIYNENYLRAKLKSYNGKINRNFRDKKIAKEGFNLFLYQ